LIYDADFTGNNMLYDQTAGPSGYIGYLFKPSGYGTAVLLDRLLVNKDGGFSWLRDITTVGQKPQGTQSSPLFYAGSRVPDNTTYTNVGTPTEPVGLTFDGTVHLLTIPVPAGWYVKLTVTNATIGTGTYY